MTIPNTTTVAALSREYVVPTWYPGGFLDQFIRKIPFQKIDQPGPTLEWARATAAPVAQLYTASTVLAVAATDMTAQSITMRRIGDICEVDTFMESANSDPNNQLQAQIEAKKVAVIRELSNQMINGTAGNFDSLDTKISTGTQQLSIAAPTKEQLHQILLRVTASDGYVGGGADCLVASARAVRYIIKLMEDAAGGGVSYVWDPDLGVSVPTFHGVPIYIGNVAVSANLTSIWALKIYGRTGIRIVHGSGSSSEYGLEVREVPMQGTISKRGAFVGGYYGLIIPEVESIARIKDVDVTAFAT